MKCPSFPTRLKRVRLAVFRYLDEIDSIITYTVHCISTSSIFRRPLGRLVIIYSHRDSLFVYTCDILSKILLRRLKNRSLLRAREFAVISGKTGKARARICVFCGWRMIFKCLFLRRAYEITIDSNVYTLYAPKTNTVALKALYT